MVIRERQVDRESIMGAIICICIVIIALSVASIRFFDVKVTNIKLVDAGLYTVITKNGPTNIRQDDILRIERTFTKGAITGTPVEQDRIYTTKGFIFISSLDSFYKTGVQLINSVDFDGNLVWIKSDKNAATESVENWNQLLKDNLRSVQPFSYAIGTPSKTVTLVFSALALQYSALSIGGMALVILIFPIRWKKSSHPQTYGQGDHEYNASGETSEAVAK
ncbi:MAG TPA: hypothetical protein VFC84_00540 [Desulfosporosinus sp.]|nr:hypothetical protein [Desulfosporosinus sp.]